MDQNITIDQIADLFKIQPIALIIVAAFITALTETLKVKIAWLSGNKVLLVPFISGIGIALMIPGIVIADRLRVGILAALVSVIGWEFIKSVAARVNGGKP